MGTSSSIIAEILQNINLQKQFCLDTEEVSVALNKGYVKTIVINYIITDKNGNDLEQVQNHFWNQISRL